MLSVEPQASGWDNPAVLGSVRGSGLEAQHAHLLALYRTMVTARAIDRRMWALQRQRLVTDAPSSLGHEAIQVAAGAFLRPGVDWALPHAGSLAFCLSLGMTPLEFLLTVFARASASSGGRTGPGGFSLKRARIVTTSALEARQVVHAAGIAYASKLQHLGELVMVCVGQGAADEGDWHEGLNFAAVHRLPLVCVVEDSMSAWHHGPQMGVETLAKRALGYGIAGETVDGGDLFACHAVLERAVDRAHAGEGPTLIHARVVQLTSMEPGHDRRIYHAQQELEGIVRRDPIERVRKRLLDGAILDEVGITQVDRECAADVSTAVAHAQAAAEPEPYAAKHNVLEGV